MAEDERTGGTMKDVGVLVREEEREMVGLVFSSILLFLYLMLKKHKTTSFVKVNPTPNPQQTKLCRRRRRRLYLLRRLES